MGLLSLFGIQSKSEKIKAAIAEGAIFIDVRTKEEFRSGHIKQCKNIPLANLSNHLDKLKAENKTVITCCRSGARSGMATSMLKNNGIDSINGGSWNNLAQIIKS